MATAAAGDCEGGFSDGEGLDVDIKHATGREVVDMEQCESEEAVAVEAQIREVSVGNAKVVGGVVTKDIVGGLGVFKATTAVM